MSRGQLASSPHPQLTRSVYFCQCFILKIRRIAIPATRYETRCAKKILQPIRKTFQQRNLKPEKSNASTFEGKQRQIFRFLLGHCEMTTPQSTT